MPTDKIGVYTRFFEYANFRLPLSTFLVNVLKHYRILISQLFVIGMAKVSHFEIICRVYGIEPTVGLFHCFYVNSKTKGWMWFSKRQGSDAVCYTKPLDLLKGWNDHFSGSMLLLALLYFRGILVRIGERQRNEDEPKILETTVRRVVLLLLAKQGDFTSGGHGVGIRLVDVVVKIVVEDVAPVQPNRQKKRKTKVVDVGEPLHLAKKLKDDHRGPGGPTVGGKSQSSIQRLFAGAVKNAEVRGGVMPTLPFVTSSVFTTPVRKGRNYIELLDGANLHTIGAPQRFIISSDSSDHSGVNIGEAEVDYVVRTSVLIITSATTTTPTADPASIAKEKLVGSSVFGVDSPSAGECHPIPSGFFDCTGSDFLIGGIRTVIDPDFNLQKFFSSVRGMEHEQLFIEFNVGSARQMSLSAEVRMHAECNIKERRRLIYIVEEKDALLKAKDKEIRSLNAQLVLKEAEAVEAVRLRAKTSKFKVVEKSLQSEVVALKERNNLLETEKSRLDVKVADLAASVKVREQEVADLNAVVTSVKLQNDNLVDQVHRLEASSVKLQKKVTTFENCLSQLEKLQDDQIREMNDKFDKLDTDLVEMALQLEERFYPHLLTTISGRRWLLTHGLELAIAKCLNSTEYLSTFGVAIGKAVKKGMQDELSTEITHGVEGRVLTDVVAYNPSTEADYLSALQHLQSVNFSLIAELKSNKDASIDTIMNLLPFSRVRRIKENISKHRSALRDVFVSLSEPLSITAGTKNDYEIMHTEGEKSVGADANPFLDVDDAKLNIP
nr:putative transposase (putative), gypsy type [Tanacetum cinerariifolium]